jgi:hypothetical protein
MACCFAKHILPCFNGLMASFSGSSRIFMDGPRSGVGQIFEFAVRDLPQCDASRLSRILPRRLSGISYRLSVGVW